MPLLSSYIIVDVLAKDGSVGIFWSRTSDLFLDHLAPTRMSLTRPEQTVSILIRKALREGNRKLIILGDQHTVFEAINELMQLPFEFRKQLEIGLWPLRTWEMVYYSVFRGKSFQKLIKIFKMGHTCLVDLGKTTIAQQEHAPNTVYFWSQCQFSFFGTMGDKPFRTSKIDALLSRFSWMFVLPKANFLVEHHDFEKQGGLNMYVVLHKSHFCSVKIGPEELAGNRMFRIYWQRWRFYGGRWLQRTALGRFLALDPKRRYKNKCQWAQIQSHGDRVNIMVDGQPMVGHSIDFEVEKNALPVIVQLVPVPSKAWKTKSQRVLKPVHAIANRKKSKWKAYARNMERD